MEALYTAGSVEAIADWVRFASQPSEFQILPRRVPGINGPVSIVGGAQILRMSRRVWVERAEVAGVLCPTLHLGGRAHRDIKHLTGLAMHLFGGVSLLLAL